MDIAQRRSRSVAAVDGLQADIANITAIIDVAAEAHVPAPVATAVAVARIIGLVAVTAVSEGPTNANAVRAALDIGDRGYAKGVVVAAVRLAVCASILALRALDRGIGALVDRLPVRHIVAIAD